MEHKDGNRWLRFVNKVICYGFIFFLLILFIMKFLLFIFVYVYFQCGELIGIRMMDERRSVLGGVEILLLKRRISGTEHDTLEKFN